MSMVKSNLFSADDVVLANMAKALSHPARIAILRELANKKTCVCGEIVEVLPLAQATVSQHLKELKELGIIKGTVEGAKTCYCINWEMVEKTTTDFLQFFKRLLVEKNNELCC